MCSLGEIVAGLITFFVTWKALSGKRFIYDLMVAINCLLLRV